MRRARIASVGGPWLVALEVVVAVACVAVTVVDGWPYAGAVEVVARPGDPGAPRPDPGPESEAAGAAALDWPPGVRELARFVEEERGLRFRREVTFEYLSRDEFAAAAGAGFSPDDPDVAEALADALGELSAPLTAFGLLAEDVDAVAAQQEAAGESTAAVYLLGQDRIVVNGSDTLTTELRRTLVHELTHAVTDQALDTAGTLLAIDSWEEDTALRVLVEGDAEWVASRWVATLSQAELDAALERERERAAGGGGLGFGPGPSGGGPSEADLERYEATAALGAQTMLPYLVGTSFVQALWSDGGADAVNAAYADPPRTLEQALDPLAYLEGDEPLDVAAPEPPDGAEGPGEPFTWGAYGVYSLLASRIDPAVARVAAEGWGGDTVRTWTQDGAACAGLVVRGDTPEDDARLAEALRAWAEAAPWASGNGPHEDGGWWVTGCARGAADAAVHPPFDTLTYLALRPLLLTQGLYQEGLGLEEAAARADCAMASVDYAGLLAGAEADPGSLYETMIDAWDACADVPVDTT